MVNKGKHNERKVNQELGVNIHTLLYIIHTHTNTHTHTHT